MLQEHSSEEGTGARKRLPPLTAMPSMPSASGDHASDGKSTSSLAASSPAASNGDAVLSRRVHGPSTSGSSDQEVAYASPSTSTGQRAQDHENLLKKQHAGRHENKKFSMEKNEGSDRTEATDSSSEVSADETPPDLSRLEQCRRWLRRIQKTFGTPFLLLVSAVYASQGFNSFSALAINYYFKDNLKLQPAESQALTTVMMFPWGVKPVYGIISDSLPLCQYHRKSYIMLFSTLGALTYLLLALPDGITTSFGAVAVLMLNNLSTAVIDVVIDARVVEMSRLDPKHGANDLQSVSWTAMAIGGVIGSFLSGPATHELGVRGVFFFSAVAPCVVLAFSAAMREAKSRVSSRLFLSSAKRQLLQLKGAILTPVIWKCALWVFLSGAVSPGYSQVFFYFSTDVLKFTPEFLGTVSAFGFVFLLIGTLIFNAFFKDVSFRRIFLIAQLSLAAVSLLDIILVTRANLKMGIPDKAFVLGDAVIADVVSRLKTMPVLVLCAKLCPKGVEGTLFALLMSISNFSFSVSEFWGAFICHALGIEKDAYDKLWIAILLRSVLKLTPILFLFLIPTTDPQDIVDQLVFDDDRDTDDDSESGQRDSDDIGVIRRDHAVNGSPEALPQRPLRSPPPREDLTLHVVV
ncbi:hypothetical protein ATCC90586_006409 [Pythium insidiosum]|nr:hypothetical protein ATCC90586_006409 [Pythium insidiosum]